MRENKHQTILKVAAGLISRKGYDGVSLQEIANKVGLHKSTLFHYFRNKEELLLQILEESVGEVNRDLGEIVANNKLEPRRKLKEAINNHLISLTEHFDNVNIYLNELRCLSPKNRRLYLKKRKEYENNFETLVIEMKANGMFEELDPKIVTYGFLGMLNWVVKWYKTRGRLTIEEISNIFYKMVVK